MNPQLFIAIDAGDCYDHVEAEVSDLIAAALNLEGVETVETSVMRVGEFERRVIPVDWGKPGRYAIIPLPPEADE